MGMWDIILDTETLKPSFGHVNPLHQHLVWYPDAQAGDFSTANGIPVDVFSPEAEDLASASGSQGSSSWVLWGSGAAGQWQLRQPRQRRCTGHQGPASDPAMEDGSSRAPANWFRADPAALHQLTPDGLEDQPHDARWSIDPEGKWILGNHPDATPDRVAAAHGRCCGSTLLPFLTV